jgi:hypothetical protein
VGRADGIQIHQFGRDARACEKAFQIHGGELRLGTAYYGGIINRYTYPETLVYGNLKFILTEMAVNKKIVFKYNKYNATKCWSR